MTNNQILVLALGLKKLNPPNMNGDFNYAISHNLESCMNRSRHIREAIKDGDRMIEYRKKLQALQEENAIKDKKGNPISEVIELPNGNELIQYNIPSAMDPESEFSIALKELDEEYKDDIEKQVERMKYLQQENDEIDIVMIDKKDIPDGLTRDEMNLILPLIKRD